MQKKRLLFLFLAILVIAIYGCAQQNAIEEGIIETEEQQIEETEQPIEITEEPIETQTAAAKAQEIEEKEEAAEERPLKKQTTLTFSRKIKIADAVFPGIFFADGNFYITYNKNNNVYIKKFDNGFNEIEEKKLTSVNKVNDIQVAYDDGFFYIVYSTAGKSGTPDKGLYLKKFDLNLNEIKGIAITEEAPKTEATNDMFLSLINDLLYVGTFYIPANPGPGNNFGHNIRVFDMELSLKNEFVANDLNHQNGASLVFSNDKFTITSGANVNFNSQSRDLIALSYDIGWSFLNDNIISSEPEDEYWPMGAFSDGSMNYIAHISRERFNEQFCQTCDMGNIILKRYDKEFDLIDKAVVEDEFLSQRAHVLKAGNKVYVAYDSSENNQFKVYAKEFVEQ